MDNANLDQLRLDYKQATDQWVTAIVREAALATPDHSEVAWEHWDDAGFAEQDAGAKAKAAKDAYKDALREANLGF
jgi:hypothetical protein